MKRYSILCAALFCALTGCALPPADTTRQSLVPESEVQAVRYTKEGIAFMREGRYLDAEMSFERALYIEPKTEAVLTNIGVSLFMQERFDESLALFKDLESKDTGSLVYKLWVGRSLVELGKFNDGIAKLQEGLSLAIKREDTVSAASFSRTLSVIYFQAGYQDKALCASSDAFNYVPSQGEAVRHARLLMAIGATQNAAVFLQGFFGATTLPSVDAHLVYAQAALMVDALEGAADFLQDAMLMNAQDPDTQYLIKLLTLVLGVELKERGIHSDLQILDVETQREVLTDPRLDSAEVRLYLPVKILSRLDSLKRALPPDTIYKYLPLSIQRKLSF